MKLAPLARAGGSGSKAIRMRNEGSVLGETQLAKAKEFDSLTVIYQ